MAAGLNYNLTPIEKLKEYCNVKTIFRRTGGFNLVTDNLVSGTPLPPCVPVNIDFLTRKATIIKNVKVYEDAGAEATAIKVYKKNFAYIGMYLGNGAKSAIVSAIDKSNANYDTLTISLTSSMTAGEVLFETEAVSAGTKGVHTLTIGTNPTAGDKITINGIEFEFSATAGEGLCVVGGTASATAKELDSVLEQETALADIYQMSYKGAKIEFKEKIAGAGIPALVVTPVDTTGTLAATIVTTTAGAVGAGITPKLKCNGLTYDSNKAVGSGESITVMGGVLEIKEKNLVYPISAPDKEALGDRFDFI